MEVRHGALVKFYSQVGQDKYIWERFFRGKRNGVFVDVGAYDGETFSNSMFFERAMGWRGLCIEPLPSAFARLKATRQAICEPVCVADFEGDAEFTEAGAPQEMLSGLSANLELGHLNFFEKVSAAKSTHTVPVTRLSTLLSKHSLFHIDYCSIDTEGSEMAILSELDLNRFHISVLTVEDNDLASDRLPQLMAKKGYDVVTRLVPDWVFKRRDIKM